MIVHLFLLIFMISTNLTCANVINFSNRRFLIPTYYRHGGPYGIRMPYPKILPQNPLFAHSVAWKIKKPEVPKISENERQTESQQVEQSDLHKQQDEKQQDVEVTQFHTQDANGHVVFGFNSPDQMRVETRNSDGTVHGTYSYLDPRGQIIRRQYWDTGAGFHVTGNSYPLNGAENNNGVNHEVGNSNLVEPEQQYTPEVQAARDLHFQLYQQTLASLLTQKNSSDEIKLIDNISTTNVSESWQTNSDEEKPKPDSAENHSNANTDNFSKNITTNTNSSISASVHNASGGVNVTFGGNKNKEVTIDINVKNEEKIKLEKENPNLSNYRIETGENNNDENNEEEESDVQKISKDHQNGTIIIPNPEYLRISWVTDTKPHNRFRSNSADRFFQNGYLNTNRRSRFVGTRAVNRRNNSRRKPKK